MSGKIPSRLQKLRDRLLGLGGATEGATPRPEGTPPEDATRTLGTPGDRIGPYRLLHKLGQGGMGVVFAARDERLGRTLAIKTIAPGADERMARRFWREARVAASVNHPHICQLYEVGEHEGGLFIAMELLEGEPLSERLRRGPLPLPETMELTLQSLSALQALHARGLVHRDLKPSNVFLTPHGAKVLDFGLARETERLDTLTESAELGSELTQSGMIVGTPRYMAPEQVRGGTVDARTDLFALGAIVFEMLAGRPAFGGNTVVEVLYATLHEQPPALTGSGAVAAVDRVIRKALAKNPADRPASAEAMAGELRAIPFGGSSDTATPVRALTRLVVLPFRALRPDPDTDFLSFSLADAVSTSLAGLRSLVVRSSAAAARIASEPQPDLKRVAAEADVDLVLLGTLLRSGEQVRVSAQLVEAPSGTLVASHTVQAAVGDVFHLQDELARKIVDSLALPLTGRAAARGEAPASPRAYEFFLRANELARQYDQLKVARDLYLRSVEEDPGFAPAWARLGRCHRVIGKYFEESAANRKRAEGAFKRALELNPDLSIAHKFYAHLEAESGRAPEAMVRLLRQAQRDRNDPELFAGLVHACRYSGLLEASLAAHEEARRLDPRLLTSVGFTLLLRGEFERLLREDVDEASDFEPKAVALVRAGRREEAKAVFERMGAAHMPAAYRATANAARAALFDEPAAARAALKEGFAAIDDPEWHYTVGTLLARVGDPERAVDMIEKAVDGGYLVAPALAKDPVLDPLRGQARFEALLARAESRREAALAAFRQAGGESLLGTAG